MILRNILILMSLFVWAVQITVDAQCRIGTKAFAPGEQLIYDAFYNWGFIWINAGEVEFNVSTTRFGGREVYHFRSLGRSHRSYDWIFMVRQRYESHADKETLMPLWYQRDVIEGNYTAFEEYTFDYRNNVVHTYVQKRRNPEIIGSLPITPCLFDLLTAIYYFRSYDVSNIRVGDRIPLNMLIDSQTYQLHMRFVGREQVRTRNRQTFNCLKFAIQLVAGTVFNEGEEVFVWVTDDKNKVPIIVEAQIRVGAVRAELRQASGLKH